MVTWRLFSHCKIMSYHRKMCEEHTWIMDRGRLIMDGGRAGIMPQTFPGTHGGLCGCGPSAKSPASHSQTDCVISSSARRWLGFVTCACIQPHFCWGRLFKQKQEINKLNSRWHEKAIKHQNDYMKSNYKHQSDRRGAGGKRLSGETQRKTMKGRKDALKLLFQRKSSTPLT